MAPRRRLRAPTHLGCITNAAAPATRFRLPGSFTPPATRLPQPFPRQATPPPRGFLRNPPPTIPTIRAIPRPSLRPLIRVSIPSSTAGRWMFRVDTTMRATTANTRLTVPASSTRSSSARTRSPASGRSIISASRKAATAKATCCKKRNGRRTFWRRCKTRTAASISWSILVRGATKMTCCRTTAIHRSSGQRTLQPRPPRWRHWRRFLPRRYSRSNSPRQQSAIAQRRYPTGNSSWLLLRSTAVMEPTKSSPITVTSSCTTMNWPGQRASYSSRPAKMPISKSSSPGLIPQTPQRAAGAGGDCTKATGGPSAVTCLALERAEFRSIALTLCI